MNYEKYKKECQQTLSGDLSKIALNVRKLRIKNNMTQQQLACDIYSDTSLIVKLEGNKLNNITLRKLTQIADVFKISSVELFK